MLFKAVWVFSQQFSWARVSHIGNQSWLRRTRHVGWVAREIREISVRKPEGTRPLGNAECRWVDSLKVHHGEVAYEDLDWIHLTRDSVPCRVISKEWARISCVPFGSMIQVRVEVTLTTSTRNYPHGNVNKLYTYATWRVSCVGLPLFATMPHTLAQCAGTLYFRVFKKGGDIWIKEQLWASKERPCTMWLTVLMTFLLHFYIDLNHSEGLHLLII
jgi:hypothetical protein